MLSQLTSLVPGQQQAQGVGQTCKLVDDGVMNIGGGVSVRQVEQHHVAGGALHKCADRSLIITMGSLKRGRT